MDRGYLVGGVTISNMYMNVYNNYNIRICTHLDYVKMTDEF